MTHISVKEHPLVARRTRVWIDGEEVTKRCVEADDEAGYVIVFRVRPDGSYVIDHSKQEAVRDRIDGEVYLTVDPEAES